MTMKRKKHRKSVIWILVAIVVIIVAAIVVNALLHDAIDDMMWEKRNATPTITTDTIAPGMVIDSTGITGLARLGEPTADVVKRASAQFEIDSIITGDSPTDVNYTLNRNGETLVVLQNSSRGTISTIFILGKEFFTDHGLGVGSTFASVFAEYKNAEMRLGETEDGINGSCELCKAIPGMLVVKWLDDDPSHQVATYDNNGVMLKLNDNYHLLKIDEIIITPAIWE